MVDICKYNGYNCTLKEQCYRYTSVGNPLWQSYFQNVPEHNDEYCEYFMKDLKQDVNS